MARVIRLPAPQAEAAPLDSLSLAPGQPDRSQAVALDESKRQIATSIEASLTGRQRRTMEARAALLNYCNAMAGNGRTLLAAYETTAREANTGLLPPDLQALVPIANDRSGGQARLSARTLRRWASDRKKIGKAGVAPQKTREREAAPVWMDEFLRYYARPMKPSIADAMRQWQEDQPEKALPSYSGVRAALGKLSHHERANGREGRLALKARSAFTKRDTTELLPGSVYAADGTTWDREVEHPIHGRPFKPELTTIIDAHTRMVVGWSAGLAENWQSVADALLLSCQLCIPAIFYTDRGGGYVNERLGNELTGVLARLGATHMRALPYHSWAKGNVEAFQKQWIALAKRAPTYTGRDMDKEAKLLAFKTTRRDIALVGKSRLLTPWEGFLQEVEGFLRQYNFRPHRGLPRIRDPHTGVKRHLSPMEMWERAVKERGFEPFLLDEGEAEDIFRPYEIRSVRRCCVQLGTNSYFDHALDPFHEKEVMVGYDMRDASRVWVREIERTKDGRIPGRLICIAAFEGNSARYVPVSMEQRLKGRLRRLEVHRSTAEAELRPGVIVDASAMPHLEIEIAQPNKESPQGEAALPARSVEGEEVASFAPAGEAASRQQGRPNFTDDEGFARWIVAHADEATETDRVYAAELLNDRTTREMLRIKGVDLQKLRAIAVGDAT